MSRMSSPATNALPSKPARRRARVLPGFGLSLGYTMTYLSLIVLIPLSALFFKSASLGWRDFYRTVTSPEVMAAYRMSFGGSLIASLISVVFGLLVAWVLARYRFFGRRIMDALIDLPFALPTAVAGITLTTIYSENGWVGKLLARAGFHYPWPAWQGFSAGWWPFHLEWYAQVAFTPLGVVVALVFIGLPFVVRTVQPIVQDLAREVEEASASLGAGRWQTFRRVIFPELWPALLTGFALSLARGLGEYGSVVFISGNLPMRTEIAPHQIITKLEQYNYPGATAIAVVVLLSSLVLLMLVNVVQKLTTRPVT